jgi:hypothetical protein
MKEPAYLATCLYQALKSVEFGFAHTKCQACGGWMVGPHGETDFAHTAKCPVNIALSWYEGKRPKEVWYKDRCPKKKVMVTE